MGIESFSGLWIRQAVPGIGVQQSDRDAPLAELIPQ